MDQLTRRYVPPHFVRRVEVTYVGKPVMTADVDFSISENPNFRFYFTRAGGGQLEAKVVDNQDLRFSTRLQLAPGRIANAPINRPSPSASGPRRAGVPAVLIDCLAACP